MLLGSRRTRRWRREPGTLRFGTLAQTGTVETGKRADLILLEANPLSDIRNTTRRAGVMLGGKWLPRAAIDARLDDIAGSVAN